jgi:hypothetical protein
MNKTLTIPKVDLELLEKQRHALHRIHAALRSGGTVTREDRLLLEGVINMLGHDL